MASTIYDIYVPIRNSDGTVMWYKLVDKGTGTSDYTQLSNLPTINNVTLVGNKTLDELGIDIPTNVSQLENDKDYMSYDEMVLIENDPVLGTYICRLGQEGTPLTYNEIKDAVDNPESFVFIRYGGCLYIPNVEPENNAIRFVARYPAVNAASYSRTLSIGISTINQIILRETQDERSDNKVSDMTNDTNIRHYPTVIAVKNFVENKGYLTLDTLPKYDGGVE